MSDFSASKGSALKLCTSCFFDQVRSDGPGGPFLLFTERSGLMRTLPFHSLCSPEVPELHQQPLGMGQSLKATSPSNDTSVKEQVDLPYGASSGRGGSLATMLQAMRSAPPLLFVNTLKGNRVNMQYCVYGASHSEPSCFRDRMFTNQIV
jgi:hypothetical protein